MKCNKTFSYLLKLGVTQVTFTYKRDQSFLNFYFQSFNIALRQDPRQPSCQLRRMGLDSSTINYSRYIIAGYTYEKAQTIVDIIIKYTEVPVFVLLPLPGPPYIIHYPY